MKLATTLCVCAGAALLTLFGSGCSTVPLTGRSQLNLVSASQEMQLGLSSFDQLKQETPVSRDAAINALVQRVGKRIADVAGKDMPDAQWEFVVFDSKEANAFCLPGGKVGVYTGILPITKDEAGLATVIGHEVAHAVARHGAERMSEAMVMQTGGQLLGAGMSMADPRWQQITMLAYGAGAKVGRELPHSRAQESEADHIGLMYMARAGYDPKESIHFWQRFSEFNKQQGGGGDSFLGRFLSTHPVDEVRIEQLRKLMPKAEAEFRKSAIR
ncbi:MAG TPA: M48 family metallopeptidase [Verrucomicrobiae bacterium]|nr:M48 family metallopeptidase [Verrucomicrobiae bacterium]